MDQNKQRTKDAKTVNLLLIAGLIYALVVMTLIGAIVLVRVNRKETNSSATQSNNSANTVLPTPSLALAESVCSEYGGEFKDDSEARFGGYLSYSKDFSDAKICEKYTHQEVDRGVYSSARHMDGTPLTDEELQDMYGVTIGPKDFSYEIGILKEDTKENYRAKIIKSVVEYEGRGDVSPYTILENSDELFKACNSVGGMMITCEAFYDDIFLIVTAQDYAMASDIFAELGFPDETN